VDILIVDDESSLRDFLTIVFEEDGWHASLPCVVEHA
jgi:DNA-binding response OmpR family regulator